MLKPLTVWITTYWKIPQEMIISDHLICLLRNLYAGQEATVRTGHGTTDWFQIGKGVHQCCILSSCSFNLYAEYIMWNSGLDEAQTGKFFKRLEYQATLPASWKTCMQVKKQQLEPDMEKHTCSKSGKEYIKTVYCHPVYLTYMQSTSCKILDWMKHKLESRLLGEISITSDMQRTPPLW